MLCFLYRAPLAALRFVFRIFIVPLLVAAFGRWHNWLHLVAAFVSIALLLALKPVGDWLLAASPTGWIGVLGIMIILIKFEYEMHDALCRWVVEKAKPTRTTIRGRESD